MYKILIVDDEHWIRKGIIAKFKNLDMSFSWIGEASNGQEAYELIEVEKPDIVITDIKMPHMDGIELIKNLINFYPECKFIIISGYAEFEYAEQALNMGACGYILKPISGENLLNAIGKATSRLNQEKEFEDMKEKKESLENENGIFSFERDVNCIFHSPQQLAKDYAVVLPELPEGIMHNKHILVLIHIDSSNYYHSSFKYQDLELIKYTIKNILRDLNENIHVADNQTDITQLFVFLHSYEEYALKAICDHFVIEVYSKIKQFLKIRVTIAISGVEVGITGELFKQAKAAFDLRLIHGSNKIYRFYDLELKQKVNFPEHKFNLLQKCLEQYDLKNVNILLKDIFSSTIMKSMPIISVRLQYLEVIGMLLKFCSQNDIDIEKSMDSDFITGEILDHFDSVEDIANYLYTSILDIIKADTVITLHCRNIVKKLQTFIARNYSQDLIVKELAKKFAVNPNYLSTIFKEEANCTITKFIENIRMEKACQLLQNSKYSISDIAISVGYNDAQYFYRVFKKAIGVTPAEYRIHSS